MIRKSVAFACIAIATGCTTAPAPAPSRQPPAAFASQPSGPVPVDQPLAQCDAAPAQFAVGQELNDVVVEDARKAAGARTARILRPGQPVTTEFSDARLNLSVDQRGVVTAVRCG